MRDSGTMADFLAEEDHDLLSQLITIERYGDQEAWTAQVEAIRAGATGHPRQKPTRSPEGPKEPEIAGAFPSQEDRVYGCFVVGAIGDALGAAMEFDDIAAIRDRFGPGGLQDFAPAYGRLGAITDDTQMTLFTAEGLLRAYTRQMSKGICYAPGVVDHAYARWLRTQGEESTRWDPKLDGWLVRVDG